ncbi:hypothetical protein [Brachyspira pilosicoli]|uniref:hypothetical protein n=1 Tax=Brachyspira pilosicoli TaxID=52584 RepID=UPI001CA4F497|nr:hypothetical protein [Brachyspira pilosicoli]MBW5383312.1 hypothetical protein [Brachyspira pilosicoli]
MKKTLFITLSLFTMILFLLSCNNNSLKPDTYTKEEIDKKYPYWNIGMSEFKIAENLTNYATITVEEKRFILRCMALMRLAVNTSEFPTEVQKKDLASSVNASYGSVTIKIGDKYDKSKIVDVIRSLTYTNFIYEKMSTGGAAFGTVGQSRYVRYVGGQDPNQIPTANWVGFENANWIQWSGNSLYGYASFSGLMFHEHMHNIGFTHVAQTSSNNVPYALQDVVQKLIERILYGDLKSKYAKALDELTAYYYTEYKDLLLEDSVFDPSKK